MTGELTELLITLFSSAGLAGALFALLLEHVLKRAKADAERRRKERISLEILRCEGEEVTGNLLMTLVSFGRGLCGETELNRATEEYERFLEKSRALKNSLLTGHTEK